MTINEMCDVLFEMSMKETDARQKRYLMQKHQELARTKDMALVDINLKNLIVDAARRLAVAK